MGTHSIIDPMILKMIHTTAVIFLFLGLAVPALAKPLPNFGELELVGYDAMHAKASTAIVESKAYFDNVNSAEEEAEAISSAVSRLRKVLRYLLTRPNKDNMVEKLVPDLRRELNSYNSYADTMASLVDEALANITSKKLSTNQKTGYLFILENALSEMRPAMRDQEDIKAIFERVANSKLKVPQDVQAERRMRGMMLTTSPVKSAQQSLDKYYPNESKNKKKWWQFWK